MAAADELRDRVGEKIHFRGADSVTQNDIRRKLEVFFTFFSCPLHDDEAAAKAHGYLGVVAPVTMTPPLWGLPPYWAPGQPSPYLVDGQEMTGNITDTLALPFSRSVNVSSEWQYHAPLYLGGDRLQGTTTIISVEQKRTRVGTGVFLQYESEYVKVSGELVARNRNTVFNYDPDDASRPEPGTSARAQQGDRGRSPRPVDDADTGVDWNTPLEFDDVTVGAQVRGPALALTYQRMVMNIAADRMFSGIHHSAAAAHAAGGLADIIFNTRGLEAFSRPGFVDGWAFAAGWCSWVRLR